MIYGSICWCLICEDGQIVFDVVMTEKLMGIEIALFYRCSVLVGFFSSEVLEAPTSAGFPKPSVCAISFLPGDVP